jgi:hypothetical protein
MTPRARLDFRSDPRRTMAPRAMAAAVADQQRAAASHSPRSTGDSAPNLRSNCDTRSGTRGSRFMQAFLTSACGRSACFSRKLKLAVVALIAAARIMQIVIDVCPQIVNDHNAWFGTASKSRLTFLDLLRGGHAA